MRQALYYMLDTLTKLIVTANLLERYYYFLHFVSEETEAQSLNDLLKVIWLVGDKTRIWIQVVKLQSSYLNTSLNYETYEKSGKTRHKLREDNCSTLYW